MGILAISLFKLLPSINRMIVSKQNILYNIQSIHTIYNEILLESNTVISNNSVELVFNAHIKVKNVFFSYSTNENFVLRNIDICLTKGSVTGIIGKTGSGKSTFLDLLVGLLKPSEGAFYVDGKDIHTDIKTWRSKISYIPQSVYLFDDSIKNNIALGFEPENDNELKIFNAISAAGLEDFITELPDGIHTKVGEAGIRLSGGQRQRIGIARALYKNSEILILDEATNALDHDTEKKILKNIISLEPKKTILLISHHIASLLICAKIYKIDNGAMKEFNPTDNS